MKNIYTNFYKVLEQLFPSHLYYIDSYEICETKVCTLDGLKLLQTFKFVIEDDKKLILFFNGNKKTLFIKENQIYIWLACESLEKFIKQNL